MSTLEGARLQQGYTLPVDLGKLEKQGRFSKINANEGGKNKSPILLTIIKISLWIASKLTFGYVEYSLDRAIEIRNKLSNRHQKSQSRNNKNKDHPVIHRPFSNKNKKSCVNTVTTEAKTNKTVQKTVKADNTVSITSQKPNRREPLSLDDTLQAEMREPNVSSKIDSRNRPEHDNKQTKLTHSKRILQYPVTRKSLRHIKMPPSSDPSKPTIIPRPLFNSSEEIGDLDISELGLNVCFEKPKGHIKEELYPIKGTVRLSPEQALAHLAGEFYLPPDITRNLPKEYQTEEDRINAEAPFQNQIYFDFEPLKTASSGRTPSNTFERQKPLPTLSSSAAHPKGSLYHPDRIVEVFKGTQMGCNGSVVVDKCNNIFNRLVAKQPQTIFFNRSEIKPRKDNTLKVMGGTCSAMAFRYAVRSLNAERGVEELIEKGEEIGKEFGQSSAEFRTQQAAFNAIKVHKGIKGADYSRDKMQALLNYHDLKITFTSEEISTPKVRKDELKEQLNRLPNGTYVLRVIHPNDNDKLERHGHSVVFIKENARGIYYDPNYGAKAFPYEKSADVLNSSFKEMERHWDVTQARFYRVAKEDQFLLTKHQKSATLEKMESIPVSENVKQIRVLRQSQDGTGYAMESCGYHALKNAMILCYANDESTTDIVEKMFEDKQLFLSFNKKYVTPFIEEKNVGKRDASSPIIKGIIHSFISDPNPPQELKNLQESLKKHIDSLAVIDITSAKKNKNHEFLIHEVADLKEAEKFFHFAKSNREGSFTLVLGNPNNGHWSTVNVFRHENGENKYHFCDSNFNVKSFYVPIKGMIENYLSKPDEYLRKSFESIGEELDRKARWLSYSGEDLEEYKNMLLDNKPCECFAIPGISNGSNKDLLIHTCLNSFGMMERCGWLESVNIEQEKHVANLTKLLTFYRENLNVNSPHMQSIIQALEIMAWFKTR